MQESEVALVPGAIVVHQVGASHAIAGPDRIGEYSAYGLVRFARSRRSLAIKCGTASQNSCPNRFRPIEG